MQGYFCDTARALKDGVNVWKMQLKWCEMHVGKATMTGSSCLGSDWGFQGQVLSIPPLSFFNNNLSGNLNMTCFIPEGAPKHYRLMSFMQITLQ